MFKDKISNLSSSLEKLANELVRQCPSGWLSLEITGKSVCGMMLTTASVTTKNTKPTAIPLQVEWCNRIKSLCEGMASKEKPITTFNFKVIPSGHFQFEIR